MRNILFIFGLIVFGTLATNGQDIITVYEFLPPSGIIQLDTFKGYPNQTAAQTEINRVVTAFGASIHLVTDPCNATRSLFANPCHADATCTKAADSLVQCSCNSGYSQTSGGTQFGGTVAEPAGTNCQDDNECVTSPPTECGSGTANCTNLPGTYTCTCVSGYQLSGLVCQDVDECAGAHNCDGNATCTNTVGSFTCACNVGYTGNGTTCSDFPQCNEPGYDCGANGTCTDTIGSYFCTCNSGYTVINSTIHPNTCDDIDECAMNTDNCHTDAICTNTVGNFTCACKTGYTGDGVTCTDIDECTTGTHTCHANATCSNTPSSFTCACNSGFFGDGFSCSVPTISYDFRAIIILTSGGGANSPTEVSEIEGIIDEIKNTGSLDYISVAVLIERVNGTEYIVLISFNGTTKTADEFAALLTTHTTTLTINAGTVTSMGDFDECSENYGNCSTLATCTNNNGSFTCACPSSYYDNSAATSNIAGTTCDYPVNSTCTADAVEVWALEAFFTSIAVTITDLTLGSCTGNDTGDYWVFKGDCNPVTSQTANSSTIDVKWNLTNVDPNATLTSGSAVTYPITCTIPATQNITSNFTAVLSEITGQNLQNAVANGLSLVADVFSDPAMTTQLSGSVKTSDTLYVRLGTSAALAANIKVVLDELKTYAAGDPTQSTTIVSGGCLVAQTSDNEALLRTVALQGNGNSSTPSISFGAHFYKTTQTTVVSVKATLCVETTPGSCGTSCSSGKKKRSISISSRVSRATDDLILESSTAFSRAPGDECERDCGDGTCVLDALRASRCVCVDQAYKTEDSRCAVLNIPVVPEEPATSETTDRTTLWILIGLAVLLFVLIAVVAVVFVMRKQAANQKDYELTHVNTHAIAK